MIGKGKRVIILHAGNREEGLLEGCDLVFMAKKDDGDYHNKMCSWTGLKIS